MSSILRSQLLGAESSPNMQKKLNNPIINCTHQLRRRLVPQKWMQGLTLHITEARCFASSTSGRARRAGGITFSRISCSSAIVNFVKMPSDGGLLVISSLTALCSLFGILASMMLLRCSASPFSS